MKTLYKNMYNILVSFHSGIDQLYNILVDNCGFTEKELSFIINYYIKYQTGKELNGED